MSRTRILALLMFFVLAPAAAHAQSETISACYVPKSGSVYRVDVPSAPDACKAGHVPFSWQSGGMTFTIRNKPYTYVAAHTYEHAYADCQAGETAVSGGYLMGLDSPVNVVGNSPGLGGQHPQAWYVRIGNPNDFEIQFLVFVMCAKPSP